MSVEESSTSIIRLEQLPVVFGVLCIGTTNATLAGTHDSASKADEMENFMLQIYNCGLSEKL